MGSCRVYYRDRSGVEHGVYVNAINRYHAFALGMHEMRRCSWCRVDCREVDRMFIQRLDRPKRGGFPERIVVTREEFENWLEAVPQDRDRPRKYVLILLGRMEPDRDFKRGLTAR